MKRLAGLAAALAMAAMGCGGAASQSSSSGSSTASCTTSAQKAVEAARQPIKAEVPTEKVQVSRLQRQSVWFISPSQGTAYALGVSQGVQAAAAAAGLDAHVFDSKGQPTLYNEGVAQAVAAKAAAIITYAIDPSLISQSVQQANSAGIPVLIAMTGLPAPAGIYASVNPDVTGLGRLQADAALAVTSCKLNGAVVFASNFPILSTMKDAIKAEVAKLCSACTMAELNVQLPSISTQLAPQVTSTLARYPNLNIFVATFDSAAVFMVPAIEQTQNSTVKIVGANGNSANLEFMRLGRVQVADAAYPPAQYLGWQLFDQGLRSIAKMSPAKVTVQVQMLDKSNIGPSGSGDDVVFPGLAGYQSAFLKTWGLS